MRNSFVLILTTLVIAFITAGLSIDYLEENQLIPLEINLRVYLGLLAVSSLLYSAIANVIFFKFRPSEYIKTLAISYMYIYFFAFILQRILSSMMKF